MKRKLNDEDVPTPVGTVDDSVSSEKGFENLGLDSRLLQAIVKEGWSYPTPVQVHAIPLAIEGKDILARAKTGSGKTAAYVLPILESILRRKKADPTLKAVLALILVPTRELADQVSKATTAFTSYCAKDIRVLNLTQKIPDAVQRSLLADSPDVVVATPARVALNLSTSALSLETLNHLVIDEADLVLSYGYEEDLRSVAKSMPTGVQASLMSATLTTEVDTLKALFCKDSIVLALDEGKEDNNAVSQFAVKCAEDDKFLLVYVIFKLKLIKGKCIIFVGDIDRCYRLKLFLEQFGTKSCVLNSELPVNSRIHVVQEFNKNIYDIIIASDEHEILGSKTRQKSKKTEDEKESTARDENEGNDVSNKADGRTPDEEGQTVRTKKKRKDKKKDKEYGVSRGIDFKNVACVLNFDLPTSSKSYTHRIGRTARAGKTGMALSFVVPTSLFRKHKPTSFPGAKNDEEVLGNIVNHQTKKGKEIKDYHFDMAQVDAFRYRMTDALRAVTRLAIREARTRELRTELVNSEKLKRHFEENPDDLHHLRHDGELRAARIQPHLKHVPGYLLPNTGTPGISAGNVGFVGLGRTSENRIRKARLQNRMKGRAKRVGKHTDPLKTFNAKGRKK